MKWDNTFSVGIDAIDRQHRQIIDFINELDHALATGNRGAVGTVIQRTIDYTVTHFTFEEALMERAGYNVSSHHKQVHDDFARRMRDYQRQFDEGRDVGRKLLSDLRIWLTNHIRRDDKDYAEVVRGTLEEGWMSKTARRLFG